MFGEEPAFLPVGTEVSAKYRGAFCEAKVKKIVRNVKCKVTFKDSGGHLVVQDEDLKGNVKIGHTVEVKHPETGHYVPCVINKITDHSTYTVVFDDGDESTLRRTQLCLKGEKHFVKSDTLDELPLTHPEHFGTPVMRGSRILKSKRIMASASSESDSEVDSSDEEIISTFTRGRSDLRSQIGQVVCVEVEDRKKTMWVPALVVQPSADSTELKTPDHILVKSFKDSKFFAVSKRDVKEFTRQLAMKNEDKTLKSAFEKALQYYDTHNLPQTWDKAELLGSASEEDESSEEEPCEERDRFVAQLYKFMDDRGTPMNKAPQVASRDLNLYKLFRLVQDMGGYNKVTNQKKWPIVYSKMNLPPSASGCNQLISAYKKYLHAFEDIDRKLGCTMGTITRPRARHNSGRSFVSFRDRDHESTPKSPRRQKKPKDEEDEETRSVKDISDKSDVESIKSDQRIKARLDLAANSSASDTDSTDSRPATRESTRSGVKDDNTKSKEPSVKSLREEAKREEAKGTQEAPSETKPSKEEEEEDKVSTAEDREECRQLKKRGRKKEPEDTAKEEQKEDRKAKRRVKEDTASEQSESKTNTDEEEEIKEKVENKAKMDYAIGMKLRIKYGKGKTIKIYEAKIIESKIEGGVQQYKVHYAGWNIRYDEWVKKDRIVAVVDESPSGNKSKLKQRMSGPPGSKSKGPPGPTPKKVVRKPPAISSLGSGKEKEAVTKPQSKPASIQTAASSSKQQSSNNGSTAQRPTRSTSVESSLASGLPVKRRGRHHSGTGDVESSSHVTESDSNGSEAEMEEEEEDEAPERITRSRREAENKTYQHDEPITEVKPPQEQLVTLVPETEVVADIKTEPKPSTEVEDPEVKKNIPTVTTKVISSKQKEEPIENLKVEAEPVKEETKAEKKLDDKIYDFDESSSQDSFKNDPVSRLSAAETKDINERGRFKWKEVVKRTRVSSTESMAEAKPELEKKAPLEKEKKKSAAKTKDVDDKQKVKVMPKMDKTRGKRKADPVEVLKVEDIEKKKARRKKDSKEEEKTEPQNEVAVKECKIKAPTDTSISSKSSEKSEPVQSDPSWSPNYIPAPTLTQTVNIETKSEHDVIDEPAPQLSPIAGVSTSQPTQKEAPTKVAATPEPPQPSISVEPPRESQPTVFENTPPETPEGSPHASEPSLAEVVEVKSEPVCKEEPPVVEEIPTPEVDQMPAGADSPNACNTSTVSNGSGGSSGNAPGSESEDMPSSLKRPNTDDQDGDVEKSSSAKKRLKKPLKSVEKGSKKHRHKVSASDSDESEQSKCGRHSVPSPSSPHRIGQRVSKYNFLDLEEGKYLEGEDRIKFLMGKIQEIRKLYMQLKSEVACIDRRRKRQRRKLHDAAAAAAAAAAVAAVVSRGEAEML